MIPHVSVSSPLVICNILLQILSTKANKSIIRNSIFYETHTGEYESVGTNNIQNILEVYKMKDHNNLFFPLFLTQSLVGADFLLPVFFSDVYSEANCIGLNPIILQMHCYMCVTWK